MDVNFVWENRQQPHQEHQDENGTIIKVELLLTKAQSIFSDPFTNYEKSIKTGLLTKTLMRKAAESNRDLYAVTLHELPMGK